MSIHRSALTAAALTIALVVGGPVAAMADSGHAVTKSSVKAVAAKKAPGQSKKCAPQKREIRALQAALMDAAQEIAYWKAEAGQTAPAIDGEDWDDFAR